MYGYIYQIQCKVNNKIYIGSTNNIKKRWNDHRGYLIRGIHQNKYLQRAWNIYKENNFLWTILEEREFQSYKELLQIETDYQYKLKSLEHKFGYNMVAGNLSRVEYTMTDEQKQKISKALVGRTLSKKHKEAISLGLLKTRNKRYILTEEDALDIYTRIANGEQQTLLAKEYNVTRTTINDIVQGKSWSDITGGIPLNQGLPQGSLHHNSKLTEEKALRILNQEITKEEAMKEYQISKTTYDDIVKGRTWQHLVKKN